MAQAEKKIGHNSGISGEKIKSYVERIEKLEDERSFISRDIRDIFAEAKSNGFDAPTIRRLIRDRKLSEEKRQEQYSLFELYSSAIGM